MLAAILASKAGTAPTLLSITIQQSSFVLCFLISSGVYSFDILSRAAGPLQAALFCCSRRGLLGRAFFFTPHLALAPSLYIHAPAALPPWELHMRTRACIHRRSACTNTT